MSQAVLARQIGFTRSSIANLEAGRQRIALHLFVQIAQALDIEPAELIPQITPSPEDTVLQELTEHLADTPETTREFVRGAVAQLVNDKKR
jgi:transcriptional regulator with XRE-family HTH domain